MPTLPELASPILRLTASLSWLPPLLARVVVGAAFAVTGWGKLHNLTQTTAFFESLGIPLASVQAPFVAGVEFVGGLLLIVGLATRAAAGLLIGVMAVALVTAILPPAEGFVATLQAGIASLEASYLLLFVYLAVTGGGAVSLDRALWRRDA